MNSTLSYTTNAVTITPLLANTEHDKNQPSLTTVIIVLCVVSGLIVATLCIFLYIRKRRTSNATVENEKQHGKTSDWCIWFSTAPPATNSTVARDNYTHKTRPTAPLRSFPLLSTKKRVPTATTSRTMLDDIPLPSSMTTPLSTTLPPPPPLAATPTTTWKHDQQMEKQQSLVFEEGYDTKAMLQTSYYSSTQHRSHPPSYHQPAQEHTYYRTSPPPNGDSLSSSVDDPCLLESLKREMHINDMYYRTIPVVASTSATTLHHQHRASPSWGSSTVIQPPCITGKSIITTRTTINNNNNKNSSLVSLSMTEKLEQDAELQRLSIPSYYVW